MGKTDEIISITIFNLFFIAFIVAIIVFIYQFKSKKKEHLMQIKSQNEAHKKELLATEIEIQSQTMQHIGREIHDNVGQKLTLASLYIQQLIYENQLPNLQEKIGNINALIDTSLGDLRSLSKSLTDNSVKELDLNQLLQNECEKINALQLCKVVYSGKTKALVGYDTKAILLRIVQEFIQNSLKHAECDTITIHVTESEKLLSLTLSDNGKGFNPNGKSNGIGLSNMEKRTKILKGSFHLTSSPTEGTQVIISLPIVWKKQ